MTRLGRYTLGRLLGEGGEGRVYEATLHGPGGFRRDVALKVLHRGDDSIRREARIGGLLRHRHLVDVYEINQDAGQWFCAMELCPRGSLSPHIPLVPSAVVDVGLQVCEALGYAHDELGFVHLDLKPDNLLLSADGQVKVADLGIARAEGFDGDGRIRGTKGYIPPEQSRGGEVDNRADVFALGVTLVELATGRRVGASATMDFDSFELDAPIGTETGPMVPDWLMPAVSRCLEHDPRDRWPTMAALADALRALDVDGPSLADVLGVENVAPPVLHRRGHNLPDERLSVVGREAVLGELERGLRDRPLITLKGPAGIGKSVLAIEAAARWRTATGGQVWVCDLSAARSQDGLNHAVASAMGVPLRGGDATVQLGHALAGRGPVLLVLDNFEHVLDHRDGVASWRDRAPELRILVTSRLPLDLEGETVLSVGPLAPSASVALLSERALARGVDLSADPDLDSLAARLDGLPLAIELAAGRLGVLSAGDVLERLSAGILRSGESGRHGTLQAALAWSWDQLEAHEQSALTQLTVFAGGFDLAAAEAVLDLGGPSVVDVVESLVHASMVRVAGARFDLLASVREFAREASNRAGAIARHAAYFSGFGTLDRVAALSAPGGTERRRALSRELDNLVRACRSAMEASDADTAVDALRAAWAVMEIEGPFQAGAALARAVLAITPEGSVARAGALSVAGVSARMSGQVPDAEDFHHRALALARKQGNRHVEARTLGRLGSIRHYQGRLDEAEALCSQALALYRELGDRQGIGPALGNLAVVSMTRGEPDWTRSLLDEALALQREFRDRRTEGILLGNLAVLAMRQGDSALAQRASEDALVVAHELGDRVTEGILRGNLGTMRHSEGAVDEALRDYGEALAISRELGNRRSEGFVLINLGTLHFSEGRLEVAEGYFTEALALARELGTVFIEGHALANLGLIAHERGQPQAARGRLEAAVELAHNKGFQREEGAWLGDLARLVGGPEVDGWLDRGETLVRSSKDPAALAKFLGCKAEALHTAGRSGAEEALREAEALAPDDNADVHRDLARARAVVSAKG